MKLAACYYTWGDWELLNVSIQNILPVVDLVIVVYSELSNYGEREKQYSYASTPISPTTGSMASILMDALKIQMSGKVAFVKDEPFVGVAPGISAMANETAKRNVGLEHARREGCTHYLCMDSDEFYDPIELSLEKLRFEANPKLRGLVCASRVYFGRPDLTIGLDTTLVPFIHKITPTLRHEFNRNYPFAWEGKNIRIDPTRSLNINSGVEMSPIIMEHYSWVRRDMEAYKRKIRNSTARANLERSNILQDLLAAKEGEMCHFYGKRLVRVLNRFNIPYGELLDEDIQPRTSTDA